MTRIIGVFSGKGGVGKTTVVANLALALKEFNKRITVVDCNITTPHLSYYLGAYDYPVTLNSVLKGESHINMASHYHKGIYIVPSSNYISSLSKADVSGLKDHIKELSKLNDVVIIDSAPGFGREAMSALISCDEIILVTTPRFPELTDALKCFSIAEKLGIRTLGLVVNMAGITNDEYGKNHITAMTGLPVLAEILFDKKIVESGKRGVPFIHFEPFSKTADSFRALAAEILNEDYKPRHALKRIYSRFKHKLKRGSMDGTRVNLRFEPKVTTAVDGILDAIKTKEYVNIKDLSKSLGLAERDVYGWCDILESKGLVYVRNTFWGGKAVGFREW